VLEPKPDTGALSHGDLWARTLESVGEKPSALARLESISLVRLEGSVAFVRPISAAHASRVKAGVSWFEARFTEAAGRTIRVKIEKPAADAHAAPSSEAPPGLGDAAMRREAEGNKLVRTAMDLFQARLVRVEDDPAAHPAPESADPPDDPDDGDDD
jgi:uncharacterized membrane protein YccC